MPSGSGQNCDLWRSLGHGDIGRDDLNGTMSDAVRSGQHWHHDYQCFPKAEVVYGKKGGKNVRI
jgi:hypothetical protein